MSIKSYSSRASAVRGLARHLGAANTQDVDLAALITQANNQFVFDTEAADAAVGLKGVSEEDESLILACGVTHCPSCGIHLSNGLLDYDSLVDQKGEKEAYALQKHEWSCMGCNHEFGKAIEAPATSSRVNKTGRRYPNRNHSSDEVVEYGPSELVFELADTMPGAKRKDVVDAAIAKGVTPNTARAAYQHWRKARGLSKAS